MPRLPVLGWPPTPGGDSPFPVTDASRHDGAVPPAVSTRPGLRLRDPHDREILRLAVPAFGALVAEPLYLLADSAIVGHLGTPQLAALGLAGTAIQTLVGLFVFLAYATTASVARQLGAGDMRTALRFGVDGLWLALGLGVALALLGVLVAPTVVDAFDPSPAVHGHAVTYLRVAVLGMPGLLLTFAGTGVLRGLQDTRTPLWIAACSYLGNIVLNVTFVYGLGWGIAGSAWGTVLAQTGGAIALGVVVVRGARRHGASLRPDLAGIRASAHAGVPLLVRTLTLRVAILAATYVATSLGDTALAAHQVAFTLWSTLAFALDAIAIAGQAIVGRYLGAADVARARAATRRMIEWGVAAGAVFGVVMVLARPLYVSLFTRDLDVQALLASVVLLFLVFEPVAGVVFVLDGVLIGAGDGRYLAYAGVWTLVAFLPLAGLVLLTHGGLVALWWAFGGFMVARLVTLVVRIRGNQWLVTGPDAKTRSHA
ncbi:putative MATE family efflux protein [Thermasporomyces composti]|jgi:putative MATE family efflux protein|uniref:Putative MATE family efflux protein n=1 Tax=Thermasporomyces composti TaxID=696763 RepID=A0A3D9VGK6_THECX|nr:putative MATE family efflux protein [Thermasporomyces composti]